MASRLLHGLAAFFVIVTIGCGGSDSDEPPTVTAAAGTPATPARSPCGAANPAARAIPVDIGRGIALDALLAGDGEVGVVLGHQLGRDFCSWASFAKKLADRDLSALAINFGTTSPDDDIVAGARELRRRGAKRIFLVGASLGGTAALVAAARVDDLAGVAALSAPAEYGDLHALPAVRRLQAPALFLVGRGDTAFAPESRRLYRAAGSGGKDLVVTSGSQHGTDLLEDPRAERALLRFLTRR